MSDKPTTDTQSRDIILTGFAIIAGLAGAYLFMPQESGKEVVMAAIGLIGGFLAGRKKQ